MPYRLLLTPRNPAHHPFHTDEIPALAEAMRTQTTVLAAGDLESAKVEFVADEDTDAWVRIVTPNEHKPDSRVRRTEREELLLVAASRYAADNVDALNASCRVGVLPHIEHIKIDETATTPFTLAELRAMPDRVALIIDYLTAKVPADAANQTQSGRRNRKRGADIVLPDHKGVQK